MILLMAPLPVALNSQHAVLGPPAFIIARKRQARKTYQWVDYEDRIGAHDYPHQTSRAPSSQFIDDVAAIDFASLTVDVAWQLWFA